MVIYSNESPLDWFKGALGAVAALTLLLAGCGDGRSSGTATSSAPLDPAAAEVHYSYRGGSTPPPYHREYLIVAKQGSATISVGTYGVTDQVAKPIVTQTKPLSSAQWQEVLSKVANLPPNSDRGCPGSETYAISVSAGGREVAASTASACGDTGAAQVNELTSRVSTLTGLFDTAELMSRGRP